MRLFMLAQAFIISGPDSIPPTPVTPVWGTHAVSGDPCFEGRLVADPGVAMDPDEARVVEYDGHNAPETDQ